MLWVSICIFTEKASYDLRYTNAFAVTITEPGWESFSEEDAPPPAKKATPTQTPSSSAPKSKKSAGKPGQGNIMSFFSKK